MFTKCPSALTCFLLVHEMMQLIPLPFGATVVDAAVVVDDSADSNDDPNGKNKEFS